MRDDPSNEIHFLFFKFIKVLRKKNSFKNAFTVDIVDLGLA